MKVGDQEVLLWCGTWPAKTRGRKYRPRTSSGAAGYFLVCDGTWAESLVTAKSIHKRAFETVGDMPFVLIVNKSDLWDSGRSRAGAGKTGSRRMEDQVTSAKSGEGVEEMFTTLTELVLQNTPPTADDATEL